MYLTIDDLTTHLYMEIIVEITREQAKAYTNLAAFPTIGIERYYYKANDTGFYYYWDGDSYNQTVFVDKVRKAINTGVGEAKSYLNRYDTVAMFSDDDNERTFQDDMLDNRVKDLVVFHLTKLLNVNINADNVKYNYEQSLRWFKDVQKGLADPQWPLVADNPDTPQDDAGNIEYRGNTQRSNNNW